MKKLLTLMLVLGMTSMAGAALQISVNGEFNPPESSVIITEVPSGVVTLDIWSTVPISPQGEGEGMWALVCQTSGGSISGGQAVISHADWMFIIADDAILGGVTGLAEGENGVFGGIFTFGADIPADTTIYDYIEFHCEGPGEVVVILYQLDVYQQVIGIWDTVTIHQIPEPATMSLLSLGGLLLLRRRK
jgi:hypothetical protein